MLTGVQRARKSVDGVGKGQVDSHRERQRVREMDRGTEVETVIRGKRSQLNR